MHFPSMEDAPLAQQRGLFVHPPLPRRRAGCDIDNTRIKLWHTIKVRGKNGVGILWTRIGRKMWCMLNG